MRDEDHGPAGVGKLLHAPEAAALELCVTDRQHLVHQHDLGLEVRSDGEREPHLHSARVPLHRRVDELLDTRELYDVGELARDLATLQAEDRAIQVDVLATGQLGMKAGADLEKTADVSANRGSVRLKNHRPATKITSIAPALMSVLPSSGGGALTTPH